MMLKRLGLAAGVLVVGLFAYIASRPADFRIARSGEIAAPPAVVYPILSDFHQWSLWSPWEKLDPNLKRTFSGAPGGLGAVYEWVGNEQAGQGRMTIVSAVPDQALEIKLEFLKPFKATNQAEFILVPTATGSSVKWSMSGENGFLGKAVSVFMDMDKMVGKDFEAGLASLKNVAEAKVKAGAAP